MYMSCIDGHSVDHPILGYVRDLQMLERLLIAFAIYDCFVDLELSRSFGNGIP